MTAVRGTKDPATLAEAFRSLDIKPFSPRAVEQYKKECLEWLWHEQLGWGAVFFGKRPVTRLLAEETMRWLLNPLFIIAAVIGLAYLFLNVFGILESPRSPLILAIRVGLAGAALVVVGQFVLGHLEALEATKRFGWCRVTPEQASYQYSMVMPDEIRRLAKRITQVYPQAVFYVDILGKDPLLVVADGAATHLTPYTLAGWDGCFLLAEMEGWIVPIERS